MGVEKQFHKQTLSIKEEGSLIINLYVLRRTHLFPYTSIFLLILCVGNTFQLYKSVFSIHHSPGQP